MTPIRTTVGCTKKAERLRSRDAVVYATSSLNCGYVGVMDALTPVCSKRMSDPKRMQQKQWHGESRHRKEIVPVVPNTV